MNNPNDSADGRVNPKDVEEFLRQGPPDLAKGVELKLPTPPSAQPEAAPAAPPPLQPPDPVFAPQASTQQNAIETLLEKDVEFSAADITPTEREKEVFLASVLNDEPVTLTIELPGLKMSKVGAIISTRSNDEQRLMFDVLALDQKAGRIANTLAYMTWLQYYDATIRLSRFGDRTYGPPDLSACKKAEDAAPVLRAHAEAHFLPMSSAKWRLVAASIRLFDLKLAALTNSLIARDFSLPAG